MIISRVSSAEGSGPLPQSPPTPRTVASHFPSVTYSPVRVIHFGAERATYSPFRETIFHDTIVNPLLRDAGGEPDRRATARESKRLWTTNGPQIDSRTAKTATCPGSAFKNQALSADRLYSTNRNSLGYDVHRSLRGTSLCSTTKRFIQSGRTPESVGPGSYNVDITPCRTIHHPPPAEPPKSTLVALPSDRLAQWGGRADERSMDCAGEWKATSEKPAPAVHTFQRARQATWIEQIEERQLRFHPEARRPPPVSSSKDGARRVQRLPDFLEGQRNPISTKSGATAKRQHEQARRHRRRDAAEAETSLDSLDRQALDAVKGLIPEGT